MGASVAEWGEKDGFNIGWFDEFYTSSTVCVDTESSGELFARVVKALS
jgi:hypothetical protein